MSLQRCPVEAAGIGLVSHSYEQVAEAFAGFKAPCEYEEYRSRGGNERDNRSPRFPFDEMLASVHPAVGYNVQSTFTNGQRAYVGVTIAGLTKLLQGEVLLPSLGVQVSFPRDIENNFCTQDAAPSFTTAIRRSVVGLYDRFGVLYPNLTPALNAMSRTGGTEGAGIALTSSYNMLDKALRGVPVLDRIAHVAPGASARSFTSANPPHKEKKSHEVWCPGEAVAKGIIRSAGKAAVALADKPDVQHIYSCANENLTRERVQLRQQLEAIVAAHSSNTSL